MHQAERASKPPLQRDFGIADVQGQGCEVYAELLGSCKSCTRLSTSNCRQKSVGLEHVQELTEQVGVTRPMCWKRRTMTRLMRTCIGELCKLTGKYHHGDQYLLKGKKESIMHWHFDNSSEMSAPILPIRAIYGSYMAGRSCRSSCSYIAGLRVYRLECCTRLSTNGPQVLEIL